MNTEIIAQVSTKFDYSKEYREWLRQEYSNPSLKEHQRFLMKHTGVWDKALELTIKSEVQNYLRTLDPNAKVSVEIKEPEHKEGCLTILAKVLIGIGIAKGISEIAKNISEMVKNISETRMKKAFSEKINEAGRGILCEFCSSSKDMPKTIFYVGNFNFNNSTVNIQNNIYN